MKNWKFDLFTFKQNLTLDQLEISSVLEKHISRFDKFSEKGLTESLKYNLKAYSYDTDVNRLIESLDEEIEAHSLVYDLKDLYKRVSDQDTGMLYRDPLRKILETIQLEDDSARMSAIVNDLMMFDWVKEIKMFVESLTSDPVDQKNLTSGGAKCSKVYSVAEEVDGGHIAFICDRWFLLNDKEVKQVMLTDYITDKEKVGILEKLAVVLKMSEFEGENIELPIDDNITITISIDGKISINGDVIDNETSVEDLFNSPIIPYLKKNNYVLVKNLIENISKIIELDFVCRVTSLRKPQTEIYAFNYKENMYLYSVDKRTGSSFFEYDTVMQLIQDVQREMGYDIKDFFENKLSKEMKQYKKLEDKEQNIEMKIKEVTESIDMLKDNAELMKESAELKSAFDNLLIHKHDLTKQLNTIKDEKAQDRKRQN
jgi:hypothetical protein